MKITFSGVLFLFGLFILYVLFIFGLTCFLMNVCNIYRGSYISAHVLVELLNELGKRDKMLGRKRTKMRGLPSILSLFRNEFNIYNKTRAGMLDSIYHMALRLL